jgi:hypothetical protein
MFLKEGAFFTFKGLSVYIVILFLNAIAVLAMAFCVYLFFLLNAGVAVLC